MTDTVEAPRITIVVAAARNGVIGRDGQLPWSIPSDLKTFRRLTLDRPIIMGRKTFAAIGRPLDRRDNIVVTRDQTFSRDDIHVVHSLDAALNLATNRASTRGADEIAVVGGAEIYALALPIVDRVYLTVVDAEPDGDAKFAELEADTWSLTETRPIAPDPRDEFPATLKVYDRRRG